jgi:hypothetical protein
MLIERMNDAIATSEKGRNVSLTSGDGVRLFPSKRDKTAVYIVF